MTTTLAHDLAAPIGRIGMYYYFAPQTARRAETLGTDVVSFYFAGRGGVLGEVEPSVVDEVFYFFKTGITAASYAHGVAQIGLDGAVREHLAAADEFAHATFGAIDHDALDGFATAVEHLAALVPAGRAPLADGYRAQAWPTDSAARAFRAAIYLRELRGGVHTDIVKAAGLTPAVSCFLDHDGAYFALHGYSDADIPEVTDEHRAARLSVEADTTLAMDELLGQLDEVDQAALRRATPDMLTALKNPVPVDAR
jgi:hypothetical protein